MLTSINIPVGVKTIGHRAFEGCSSLKSLNIPDSVKNIGLYAFGNCSSLTRVDITDLAAWCNINFFDYTSNPLSNVCSLYINGTLTTDINIPDGVTCVGYAFRGYESLASITIPESMNLIENCAFENCSSLISITIPSSGIYIGYDAFFGCPIKNVYCMGSSYPHIEEGNWALTDATWHFESCVNNPEHTYSNACDEVCNVCHYTRTVNPHEYANACDTNCNNCDFTRTITHVYDNAGDTICNVCGNIRTIDHNYIGVVTVPNCTEKGYTTHTCTACGDSYTDNDIAELGHNFGDWIITDCAKGEKHHVCSTCGHVETQVIPAMGHNYSDEFTVDKAPTETEDGSVSRHCSVCDSRTDVAVIPKGALDFGACGTSAVWVLGADNTLYIIGSGETAGYSLPTKSPWYKYREDITTVKIAQNITKIGNNSFSGLSNIGLVVVENPDMQFGAYVFKTDLALIMQCDVGGNVEAYANENGYPIIGLDDLVPPVAPTVLDFANGVVTLEHKDGYEYSADGINWQSGNTFDNMPMDTVLCFYQRIAADGTNAASPASLAAKCIFVSAPKVLVGENMIWIEPEEGYEYRLEDMDWVDSNEFIDYIISGERYTVFRRMKENSDVKAFYDEIGTTVVVNGDNRIIDADSTDLAWIKKHLITTVNSNNLGADINEDGNVDIRDLVRLKKSLASIDVPSSPENTQTQTINPKIGLKLNTSYYHVVDWDDGSCLSEYQFDGSELLCLAVYDTNKEYAESDDSIIYKGIEYYPIGFGGPLPEYTLTDEEIILKFGEEFSGDPDYDEEYRLVVASTYDLLVTYSTGLMFNKGDILELNSIA